MKPHGTSKNIHWFEEGQMKKRLIDLIDQTEEIEKGFHYLTGIYSYMDMISDVPQFQEWKEELLFEFRSIPDSYSNDYIKEIIKILTGKLNSHQEHKDFNILKAKLKTVRKKTINIFPWRTHKVILE